MAGLINRNVRLEMAVERMEKKLGDVQRLLVLVGLVAFDGSGNMTDAERYELREMLGGFDRRSSTGRKLRTS